VRLLGVLQAGDQIIARYRWNANRFSSSDRSVTYPDGPTASTFATIVVRSCAAIASSKARLNSSSVTRDLELRPLHELQEDDSAAIVGLKVKRTTTSTTDEKDHTIDTVVQTADVKLEKLGALTLLARHLGIDKVTVADDRLDLTKLSTKTIATMMEELGLERR
jgi:hypothetical protein